MPTHAETANEMGNTYVGKPLARAGKKSEMLTTFTGVLGLAVMLAVPAYFVLQPIALARLRGGWRSASLVPLLLVVPAAAWSLHALAQGSNLWPLAFIFVAPIGSAYLMMLLFFYRLGAGRAS